MINGFGVNSAYTPGWVVRAVVVAVAAAVPVTTAPTRIVPASVYGNASVVVSLSQIKTVAGYASATSETSAAVRAAQIYSGRVSAVASAAGTAIVYRSVPAFAAGDAGAVGSALANAKLGTATASATATVDSCVAHRIRPAASNRVATLTVAQAIGGVTRYSPVTGNAAATGRGEASYRQSGQSYFRHDGYILNARSLCSGSVAQDKTKIIATLGSFDFANCSSASTAFLRYSAALSASGTCFATTLSAARTLAGRVSVGATAAAPPAIAVRVRRASVFDQASAAGVSPRPSQRHSARAERAVTATDIQAAGVRRTFGTAFSEVSVATFGIPLGQQSFGLVTDAAGAVSRAVISLVRTKATASGSAAGAAVFATQHFAQASGLGSAQVLVRVQISTKAQATALSEAVAVEPKSRPTSPAPFERRVTVIADGGRAMLLAFENRIMVVPS